MKLSSNDLKSFHSAEIYAGNSSLSMPVEIIFDTELFGAFYVEIHKYNMYYRFSTKCKFDVCNFVYINNGTGVALRDLQFAFCEGSSIKQFNFLEVCFPK